MNIADALRKYTSVLKKHDIDEAAGEAKVLLCHSLNLNSAQLFAQVDRVLTASEITSFEKLVERRLKREPAAYICGHKEFYGLDIYVDERVLIPRPETEVVVEEALKFGQAWIEQYSVPLLIADIGTGSGAIAVALALNLPGSRLYAVDVSEKALQVAAVNVERFQLREMITLIHGNLLEQISGKMAVIVANLPYIAVSDIKDLPDEVAKYEPQIAVDGGIGGVEIIRRLIVQSVDKTAPGGAVLLEIGQGQAEGIVKLIEDSCPGARVSVTADLAGINRVVKFENPF